jgi:hypothetical protein
VTAPGTTRIPVSAGSNLSRSPLAVWQQLYELLLAELNGAGALDWSKAVIDSSHVRALKGGRNGAEPGRPCPHGLQAPRDH